MSRQASPAPTLRLHRYLILGFILAAILATTRLCFLFAHISTNYDEGWNAVHAQLAMSGALYPPPGGLIGTNYPPLSFLFIGCLGKMIGDMVITGRLVALLGVSCTAILIWHISMRFTRNHLAASGALVLFILYNVTFARSYFTMDDPQWFAQSVSLAGLAVFLSKRRPIIPTKWRICIAAVIFVLAGFIKNNVVGVPLAITIWLMFEDRRAFLVWLLSSAATLAIGFGLCWHFYGLHFFQDVFLMPRRYELYHCLSRSWGNLLDMLPLLGAFYWLAKRKIQDKHIHFLLICAATTLLTGLLQRGGDGVNFNAFFETLSILCILAGTTLDLAPQSARWFALPFILLVPSAAINGYHDIVCYPQYKLAFSSMEAKIRDQPGPVGCEDLALCYWAEKGYKLDFFIYGQHVLLTKDSSALRNAIATGMIRAVQIDTPQTDLPILEQLSTGIIFNTSYQNLGYKLLRLSPPP